MHRLWAETELGRGVKMIFKKIREKIEDAKGWEDIDGKPRFTFRDKQMLEIALDIINQVEAEGGWIPCSERLPKYDEYVLCQGKNSQFIACIDSLDNKWRDNGFYVRINITHCQPLPQPPKGE